MIESIEFTNFKALRNAKLPLSPFTLLLGPNGSGKTTVLQALQGIRGIVQSKLTLAFNSILSVTSESRDAPVEVAIQMKDDAQVVNARFVWTLKSGHGSEKYEGEGGNPLQQSCINHVKQWLMRVECYSLDPSAIAQSVPVNSGSLQPNGAGLAAVLDDLKDNYPEKWETFLDEMREWLPEYDHLLFEKPQQGHKSIVLRTKKAGHKIAAKNLSQGTLVALALLTLAYLPEPPSLIGLEEIDRGLHPRLLRHLQDALYRLSYPESCGEKRPPIQVIATTHSPYLLDLYREHPEEVVLAEKEGLEVQFNRLSEIQHYGEILGDSPLSEIWYSGVLGGVSVKP